VIPWLAMQLIGMGVGPVGGGPTTPLGLASPRSWLFYFHFSSFLLLLKNIFFFVWARYKLRNDLRHATTQALTAGANQESSWREVFRQFLTPA
jgi:hypothetical protein